MNNAPPVEFRERVNEVLAREPDHPEPEVVFDRHPDVGHRFTLWRFLRPQWPALVLGVLLVAIETAAQQAGPLLTQRAIDLGVLPGEIGPVVQAASLFVAAVVIGQFVTRARIAWTGRLGQRLIKRLRVDVFTHLQRLSQSFFTEERIGRVLTRMTSDIDALQQLLQDGIVNLVVQGFTLLIVTGVLFAMNAQLALVVVAAIVPVMTFLTLWFRGASDRAYGTVRERIADVLSDLQENLAGVRQVTGFNRQHYNGVAHRNVVGRHRDAKVTVGRVQGIYGPSVDAVGALGEAVILVVGGRMVLAGELTIGELGAFVLYLSAFFAPIQQLINLYNTYQSGRAAVAKLADLLATPPSVAESPHAYHLPAIDGAITFEHVTFGYHPERPVLSGVDLRIEAGETVALVGPTGAGKSTLAKLITRTYDPQEGRVCIDGHDVGDVTIDSLRAQLGVVPQEPFLFSGTIRDNLLVGRPDATDEELLETCRLVGLSDLLDQLPAGLDTAASERGVTLSSGERQLVALARAMLPRPRVVVLDEATSNLDLQSEAAVERALDVLLEGRTAVIIAHRLSTALRADRVVVVADGRIEAVGSHADLLDAGGRYAGMFATWTSHAV